MEQFANIVMPTERILALKDEADNRILECAQTAGAHYLVSGDTHFLQLKKYQGIKITNPKQFLDDIGRTEEQK